MKKLGAAASIATIIAAVFTVAAYYQGRSSEAGNLEPLVVDVPRKKLTVDPNPEIIFSDGSRKIFKNTQELSMKELKSLHEIAKKISFSTTKNSELKDLARLAVQEGYIDYSIVIADDISYSPAKNDTLKYISMVALKFGDKEKAIEAAELISFNPTKNSVLSLILDHEKNE